MLLPIVCTEKNKGINRYRSETQKIYRRMLIQWLVIIVAILWCCSASLNRDGSGCVNGSGGNSSSSYIQSIQTTLRYDDYEMV